MWDERPSLYGAAHRDKLIDSERNVVHIYLLNSYYLPRTEDAIAINIYVKFNSRVNIDCFPNIIIVFRVHFETTESVYSEISNVHDSVVQCESRITKLM